MTKINFSRKYYSTLAFVADCAVSLENSAHKLNARATKALQETLTSAVTTWSEVRENELAAFGVIAHDDSRFEAIKRERAIALDHEVNRRRALTLARLAHTFEECESFYTQEKRVLRERAMNMCSA